MKKIVSVFTALLLSSLVFTQVFAEENNVTRKQFVSLVNDIFNIYTAMGTKGEFKDVELGSPDYYEFMSAKEAGYLSGYPDGTVQPNKIITRSEAAVALNRILELPLPNDEHSFADQDKIPEWAIGSIHSIVDSGIMSVDDNNDFRAAQALSDNDLEHIVSAIKSKGLYGMEYQLMNITSFDGYNIAGRLAMPAGNDAIDKLVIFVHGTGPNTYEMRRQSDAAGIRFKYLDIYAENITKDGAAFFSYNTRGISLGEEPSFYADIDKEGYRGYTPQNIAHDIKYMIEALKNESRLKDAAVILLGASEGTIIAPLAVSEYGAEADVLMLAGYCNDNMKDVLEYQLGGGMSFFNYTVFFDVVGVEQITKEMYEADPNGIITSVLQGTAFEQIDVNGDGVLCVEDFSMMMNPIKDGLFNAVKNGDDEWIEKNMAVMMPPLLTNWFSAHFELPKTEDIMTKVEIPIFIFQGTYDANCPVQGTYDVQERFKVLGKSNLTVNIYEGYNHDLNFTQLLYGAGSKAFDDIFATVKNLDISELN